MEKYLKLEEVQPPDQTPRSTVWEPLPYLTWRNRSTTFCQVCHTIAPAFFPRRPRGFCRVHVDFTHPPHTPPPAPSLTRTLNVHRRAWVFIRSRARACITWNCWCNKPCDPGTGNRCWTLLLRKSLGLPRGTLGENQLCVCNFNHEIHFPLEGEVGEMFLPEKPKDRGAVSTRRSHTMLWFLCCLSWLTLDFCFCVRNSSAKTTGASQFNLLLWKCI